jgi:putative DNA methylase
MGSNALASYIVLACRPRPADAPQTDRRSFVAELKRELPTALRRLQQGNIAPVDFAQAAIGPGMAIYSRYSRILEASGRPMSVRTALALINQTLTEVLSEQEDEFDNETRWAIAWYEQHGFEEGEFGDAELLSKAKVTSVNGLVEAGIVHSRGGKVRLLRPEELAQDWDPERDRRPTVWGAAHHLLRVYYHEKRGDQATAGLLRRLGSRGELAATSPTGSSPSPRRRAAPRTRRPTTPWSWAGPSLQGWPGNPARVRACFSEAGSRRV